MRLLPVLLACAAALLAGCYAEDEPQTPRSPHWEVRGAFTEAATQEDLDDLRARLAPWDADLIVMESYPMQYAVTLAAAEDCDSVRGMLEARPYVADVGHCRAVDPDGSPGPGDDAVSVRATGVRGPLRSR